VTNTPDPTAIESRIEEFLDDSFSLTVEQIPSEKFKALIARWVEEIGKGRLRLGDWEKVDKSYYSYQEVSIYLGEEEITCVWFIDWIDENFSAGDHIQTQVRIEKISKLQKETPTKKTLEQKILNAFDKRLSRKQGVAGVILESRRIVHIVIEQYEEICQNST